MKKTTNKITDGIDKETVFISAISESRALIEKIAAHLDNHMGIDPEKLNWADAETATHVLSEISEIARFLNIK